MLCLQSIQIWHFARGKKVFFASEQMFLQNIGDNVVSIRVFALSTVSTRVLFQYIVDTVIEPQRHILLQCILLELIATRSFLIFLRTRGKFFKL